ncbi:MAG: hypothetical protein JST23_07480 [Bacteroidetes bacterium]|nr:hypothetical protein [Bacteroidota bacterium]
MLNQEEKKFIQYWEINRNKKKKVIHYLYAGLPLGAIMVIATFVNFFSGWYKRADMVIRTEDKSLIIVLLIAALLIVSFIVIFSARYKWDMNEKHYLELKKKEEKGQ